MTPVHGMQALCQRTSAMHPPRLLRKIRVSLLLLSIGTLLIYSVVVASSRRFATPASKHAASRRAIHLPAVSGSFPYRYHCFAEYEPACPAVFDSPRPGFLAGCTCDTPNCPCESAPTLATAKMICAAKGVVCGGVTKLGKSTYEVRRRTNVEYSTTNEVSWVKLACANRSLSSSTTTPKHKLSRTVVAQRARARTSSHVLRLAEIDASERDVTTLKASKITDPVVAANTPLRGWSSWNVRPRFEA